MSSLPALSADPKTLRPALKQRMEEASDAELAAVHRMLLEMEARRLYESLGDDMAEDWATGRLTKENIEETILEHRQKHPYR